MWSHHQYYEQKNRRIVEQITKQGESDPKRCSNCLCRSKSSIFKGVSVYIDGHTQVPYLVLRQMICDHGGRFDPFFTGSGTTHFVAENLSYAKLKQLSYSLISIMFSKSKQSMYVVSPDWITESVKAGKRQNESAFSILKVQYGIQRKYAFL